MFLLGQNATAPRGLDLSAWSGVPLGLDLLVPWRRVVPGPGPRWIGPPPVVGVSGWGQDTPAVERKWG